MSPTEQILPLALSGSEIKKAIQDKIQVALARICHLNDNLAYGDGFSFKVTIEVHAKDLGRAIDETVEVEAALEAQMEAERKILVPADPSRFDDLEAVEATVEMNSTDPTSTRIETGQPVPVHVKDNQGKDTIRNVKYDRNRRK